MDRVFRKYIHADHLQDSGHALLDREGLIENGDHQVGADCDPDLSLHRVLAQAEEGLHPQVLLDPLEEQLDLPAGLVDLGHDQRVDIEIVGDEDQELPRFRIQKAYSAQVVGEALLGFRSVEANRLVGPQAGGLVHSSRLPSVEAHVGLRPGDEEGESSVDASQPSEIDVSTVHYVECSSLENDPIQSVDIVDPPLGDRHELGNGASQVDHCVELDRRLPLSEASPGKEVHAQAYRGRVDGVDDLVDCRYVSVRRVQPPRLADEHLSELEIDPPVAMLVGVGEIGSGHLAADAHRVEQAGLGAKARFDVPQTLWESQLGEDHAQKLIPCRKALAFPGHRIAGYAAIELRPIDHIENLREDRTADIHGRQSQQGPRSTKSNSNA